MAQQLIGKLNSVVLAVNDMTKSVKFYRDVLGFEVDYKSKGWSELKAGNFYVGMYHDQPKNPGDGPLLVFEVKDMEKTVKELKKKKVEFVDEPSEEGYGWVAVFSDPDGYCYELFQEK